MRQRIGSRVLLSVSLSVINLLPPVATERNQVKADVVVVSLIDSRAVARLRKFLGRRIAIENLDQSLVQLIKSLASFLIQIDFCVRCPDELVALPVDDLES
jgi:hypothetical protein